jgi:phospholipase/carboxylesterase
MSNVMKVSAIAAGLVLALAAAAAGEDLADAIRRGDWPAAIALAERDARANPASARHAYNLACVYSRAGHPDAAVKALGRAADLGFPFTSTMLRDGDLDPIRAHPGFLEVAARIRANNAAALEKFKAKADAKAKVLVFPPAKADRSRALPAVVALHGRGDTAEAFARPWRRVADELGAVLVVPEGLNPAGEGFDWGVVEQGAYLVRRAIETAGKQARIDPSRVVLAGFSNGASQAFIMGLQDPGSYAGILPIAGFYDERVAPVPAGARLPRFAILNGERDEEADNNRRAAAELRAAGAKVELTIYPGLGHAFPPGHEAELRRALRFLLAR